VIQQALENDDLKLLRQTLDHKMLATQRDAAGFTPLHKAVLYQRSRMVRYILKAFPGTVKATDIVRGFWFWLGNGRRVITS